MTISKQYGFLDSGAGPTIVVFLILGAIVFNVLNDGAIVNLAIDLPIWGKLLSLVILFGICFLLTADLLLGFVYTLAFIICLGVSGTMTLKHNSGDADSQQIELPETGHTRKTDP